MEIRAAGLDDVQAVVDFGEQFGPQTPYKEYDKEGLAEVVTKLIQNDDGTVMIACVDGDIVGLLMGIVFKVFYAKHVAAQELCWFVEPGTRGSGVGLELLGAFEEWAKSRGADSAIMANFNDLDPRPERLYEARGYTPMEQHWSKSLSEETV